MLDLKFIRENANKVKHAVKVKNENIDVDKIISLDEKRRELIQEVENLKQKRNAESRKIGQMIKSGQDPVKIKDDVRQIGERISELDKRLEEIQGELKNLLLRVPNIPHPSVPIGEDDSANQIIKEWGEKKEFSFKPKPHWELGEKLGLFDLQCAAKLASSGFILFKNLGARLERALINFMIDLHTKKHNYIEVSPPFLVNRQTITGTGQLPKLEDDMYITSVDDLFLIPTAEVPVTNIHSGEILNAVQLPIYYVSYTPCFRREAGSYGKETRGLTRVHQFDKVELVKITLPETSYEEHNSLLKDAEEVLQILDIPYRVSILSTGAISFAAAKCYDIEAWAPGMEMYLEVSSCSNYENFQAQRANIRFRRESGAKPEFVHTLNASGLALPRTVISLIENYQLPDGSIKIPEPLQPYFGDSKISVQS